MADGKKDIFTNAYLMSTESAFAKLLTKSLRFSTHSTLVGEKVQLQNQLKYV